MPSQTTAPYGSWKSPITSDLIVSEAVTLGVLTNDGADVYWSELRPLEQGRLVVVRRAPDGKITDVTPPGYNARTRVHEYGGAAFIVDAGTVWFSNYKDQRLYRQDRGSEPRPITPARDLRYADAVVDRPRGRLIAVREDHTGAGEAVNTLVSLPLDGDLEQGGQVLVSGSNFYSNPRLSPDGTRLAWLSWNHPNMPWDGTEFWVAGINGDGTLGKAELVAGGVSESIFQPEWSPRGVLHFVSDRTGWWNIYRREGNSDVNLCEKAAEFGVPQWNFRPGTYAFEPDGNIICVYFDDGAWHLARLHTAERNFEPIDTPYSYLTLPCVAGDSIFLIAGSPTEPMSIVRVDPTSVKVEVVRRSDEVEVDEGYLSQPEHIEYPTEHGLTAHAYFYPPRNKDYTAPEGEKPPLLVMVHGGPTSFSHAVLDLEKQYYTSRGFGVLDVNYGGSTNYGREYRQRLNGQWGVVDVDDSVNGARYLAERGDVDGDRLAITGGSAGGYTTMCALTFRDVFAAGASHFGISDLITFAGETHKFESRYLDSMIGPLKGNEKLYRDRSAIYHADQIKRPMIFFQGLEDKVVPPNQTEMLVEAVRERHIPVAYIPFEGEQHGFRRASSIKRALDGEFFFLTRIFGIRPADNLEPVQIDNL